MLLNLLLNEFFSFKLHNFVAVEAPRDSVLKAIQNVKLPLPVQPLPAVNTDILALIKQSILVHSPFTVNANLPLLKKNIPKK
jgi:hypothetical protein